MYQMYFVDEPDNKLPAGTFYDSSIRTAQALADNTGRVVVVKGALGDKTCIPQNSRGFSNLRVSEPAAEYTITANVGVFEKTLTSSTKSGSYRRAAELLRAGAKNVVISHGGTYRSYDSAKDLDKMAVAQEAAEAEYAKNQAIGSIAALGIGGLLLAGFAVYDKLKK